jgi:F0F1-type ATP synthase epsilon subunit
MMSIRLDSAHSAKILEAEARSITLATDLGQMQILPGHLSLVGTISASPVLIALAGTEELTYLIRQGVVTIVQAPNGDTLVTIAAQLVEKKEDVSIESLQSFREKMRQAFENKEDLSTYQIEFLTEQLDSVDRAISIHKS